MYVCTIFRIWYVCSLLYDTFSYLDYFKIRLDVWFYYLFLTASYCRFLFRLILNRKLWGIFEFSIAPLRKRPIFLLFVFSLFVMYWYFRLKQKQKRKSRFFGVFAWKRPFLSQIKRLFSVICAYIWQTTPHPPLLALAGWVSSLPKIFYFFIFYFL